MMPPTYAAAQTAPPAEGSGMAEGRAVSLQLEAESYHLCQNNTQLTPYSAARRAGSTTGPRAN